MELNRQSVRMQDFNRFDIERILKEVMQNLEHHNGQIIELLDEHGESLGQSTIGFFLEEMQNNSAQMIRIASLTFHKDDIFNFFSNGPLIRKEEVER